MRLKAIPSRKGIATAVSSRLCPSSPGALRWPPNVLRNIFFIRLLRRPVRATELDCVAYQRAARIHDPGWQFKHRRRLPKHTGHSERTHITSNRDDVRSEERRVGKRVDVGGRRSVIKTRTAIRL